MAWLPPDVARFLGREFDEKIEDLADEHTRIMTTFVRAYTRGNGFVDGEPNPDLCDVIITASARFTVNPDQVKTHTIGEFSETPAIFNGFTLPELTVLNLYRRRTA